MSPIVLAPAAAQGLAAAHGRAWPREACGFLLGDGRQERPIVTEIVAARGGAGEHGAFEISDYDLRRLGFYAADSGLRIVALFHSHPSGDIRLSTADRAALRYSAWPWLIVTRTAPAAALALSAYAPGDAARIRVHVGWPSAKSWLNARNSRAANGKTFITGDA